MKVGDKVRKRINTTAAKMGIGPIREDATLHDGTIIYIHPRGRFFVAEFKFVAGSIKECYYVK